MTGRPIMAALPLMVCSALFIARSNSSTSSPLARASSSRKTRVATSRASGPVSSTKSLMRDANSSSTALSHVAHLDNGSARLALGGRAPQELVLQRQAELERSQLEDLDVAHRPIASTVIEVDDGDHALAAGHRQDRDLARRRTVDHVAESLRQYCAVVVEAAGLAVLETVAEDATLAHGKGQVLRLGHQFLALRGLPEGA